MDLFRKLGKLFLSGGVDEEEFVALFSGIHHASPPDSEEVFYGKIPNSGGKLSANLSNDLPIERNTEKNGSV